MMPWCQCISKRFNFSWRSQLSSHGSCWLGRNNQVCIHAGTGSQNYAYLRICIVAYLHTCILANERIWTLLLNMFFLFAGTQIQVRPTRTQLSWMFWLCVFQGPTWVIELIMHLKFLLTPMGVLAPGSVHARPFARPPIKLRRYCPAHVSAESPSNISPNR